MSTHEHHWTPEGFERYRELYPQTPPLELAPDQAPDQARDQAWSARFAEAWRNGTRTLESSLRPRAATTTVVLVRGYLGHYMPGNLTAPCEALRRIGFDAFIARNRSGGTVAGNVAALAAQLGERPTRERLVFCGHSRGGLECLDLLANDASIARRCDGVALSQTPHGPSFVIESVLQGRHRERSYTARRRATELAQRTALALICAARGGHELTSAVWPTIVGRVDHVPWPFPVLQTASWSSQPTAWLDSFHERLGEIGPGRAHDGQFFLNDLIWPGLPHVLLPHVDHAQPAVGGHGFDPVRYWLAVLSLVLAARGASPAAFDGRCIPAPPQRAERVGGPGAGGVAPPSNTPRILSRRALPAGRLARLGATPDLHHGLLAGGVTARWHRRARPGR